MHTARTQNVVRTNTPRNHSGQRRTRLASAPTSDAESVLSGVYKSTFARTCTFAGSATPCEKLVAQLWVHSLRREGRGYTQRWLSIGWPVPVLGAEHVGCQRGRGGAHTGVAALVARTPVERMRVQTSQSYGKHNCDQLAKPMRTNYCVQAPVPTTTNPRSVSQPEEGTVRRPDTLCCRAPNRPVGTTLLLAALHPLPCPSFAYRRGCEARHWLALPPASALPLGSVTVPLSHQDV